MEYITINEFAKLANISRQAVYKRIEKDLKGYIIKEANKTKISTDALLLFDNEGVSNKEVATVTDKEKTSKIVVFDELSTLVTLVDKKENQVDKLLEIIDQMQATIDKLTAPKKHNFLSRIFGRR